MLRMDFILILQRPLPPPWLPSPRIRGLPNAERGAGAGAMRLRFRSRARLIESGPARRPGRSRLAACPACRSLGLLAKGVVAGLALLPRCERRRGGAALLLILVVLGF